MNSLDERPLYSSVLADIVSYFISLSIGSFHFLFHGSLLAYNLPTRTASIKHRRSKMMVEMILYENERISCIQWKRLICEQFADSQKYYE